MTLSDGREWEPFLGLKLYLLQRHDRPVESAEKHMILFFVKTYRFSDLYTEAYEPCPSSSNRLYMTSELATGCS